MSQQRRIGFTNHSSPQQGLPGKAVNPLSIFLAPDSDNVVTFEDARHHMLVFGTTGSGKTTGVVHPASRQLIMAGYCGLIIDVKGNMREGVRALAKNCGREDDLIEFGSDPDATALNLLSGMRMHAVRELLTSLTMQSFQGESHNKDFHILGVQQACDFVQLLRYWEAKDAAYATTLKRVAEMLDDHASSAKLFRTFRDCIYDPQDVKQRQFTQRVQSDEFHVLAFDPEKIEKSSNYLEQITYRVKAVRTALTAFLDTPGVDTGFATQGAPGLDMRGLLQQNKITLLRFGPDTGPVGAGLARFVLEEYYKTVYATGLGMAEGQFSFVVIDEFQEVADLSRNKFSDAKFIAQAREFHAIFMAATQSMAALASQGSSMAAVESFVSNCNTRVLFYSDDPYTQDIAARYDPNMLLTRLEPGQAFVIRYDSARRAHTFGIETFQKAYETTRDALKQQGNADKGGPHDH